MADGKGVIGQFTEETGEVLKEVVNDVKDSVGEALEQGFQSVAGTQLTPQQIQQKQAEDQKEIAENRRKIAFYQQTAQEQQQVRQQNQQKEQQRLQAQQQETQQEEIEEIQAEQVVKKTPEEVLRSQAERKAGKGLGG